jgi:hypothetical protein
MAWFQDSQLGSAAPVYRQVKTSFEVKSGHNITVRRCTIRNCWKEAQDGYAITLTPTRGGSIVGVTFEDCTVEHTSGWMNVTGVDSHGISQIRTSGIVWRNGSVSTNRALYGGAGRTILMTGGPLHLDIENATVTHDGTSFVYASGGMSERIRVVGSNFNAGSYGINIAGGANLASWTAGCQDVTVTGNTIRSAATAFRNNIALIGETPLNTYV